MKDEINDLRVENAKLSQKFHMIENKNTKDSETEMNPNSKIFRDFTSSILNKNSSDSKRKGPRKQKSVIDNYLNLLKEINNTDEETETNSQCTDQFELLLKEKEKTKNNIHTEKKTELGKRSKSQLRKRTKANSISNTLKTERTFGNSTNKLNAELSSSQQKVKSILKRQYRQTMDNEKLFSLLIKSSDKQQKSNLTKSSSRISKIANDNHII